MKNVICFDLEGPLSPQDNAYEVMGLVGNGQEIFEIISRYDDLLTLEGRKDYEPGDTLALIAPFLVFHGVTEEDITNISEQAMLVNGTQEIVKMLKERDWGVFIISSSYQQHAHNVANKLGVDLENTICTKFPLDKYREEFSKDDFGLIREVEKDILKLYPPDQTSEKDTDIKSRLDWFFGNDLQVTKLGKIMTEMKVIGGQRKVEAVKKIAKDHDKKLSEIVVVGDSITDFKMLKKVNKANGLAVAFNANEYALPHATIGLATTSMLNLMMVIDNWEQYGREAVLDAVDAQEDLDVVYKKVIQEHPEEAYFQNLTNKDNLDEIQKIHKELRKIVRGQAAKLG
ncbi:MAG: HAD hydrolase family protein [Thermoplasmata archaeon]|nr:HAD hydrolase family protein [Thermoplasmata archaeon]